MRFAAAILLSLLVVVSSLPAPSRACTEVRIKARDGSVVVGRSMEFAQKLNSSVVLQPKGQTSVAKLPGGKEGIKWTSKYGVLYLDGFGLDVAIDGINEAGLGLGALFFPGEAQYQEMKSDTSRTITVNDLPRYILQNYGTLDEIKKDLPSLNVVGIETPQMGNIIIPAHFSVHDKTGNGIVIEYTKDGLGIYDSIGIMTNSPSYPWHLTNVKNYVGLSAEGVKPEVIDGVSFAATGQGSGLMGIPGDPTPPSRFIRAGAMAYLAEQTADAQGALTLAMHIMNTVDIPLGTVRDFNDKQSFGDYTQWVTGRDLTNSVLYFRTYDNMTLRSIDMKKFDLSEGAPRLTIPVNGGKGAVVDVTSELKPASGE